MKVLLDGYKSTLYTRMRIQRSKFCLGESGTCMGKRDSDQCSIYPCIVVVTREAMQKGAIQL